MANVITQRPAPSEAEIAAAFDVSDIQIEDGLPEDNVFCEKQQHLLVEPLEASWSGPGSKQFVALSNVGIFYARYEPPLVPDMLLSLDVKVGDVTKKEWNSYFVFSYGKVPDVVIEVVSNKEGNETGSKIRDYARIHVRYYVIYDPRRLIMKQPLRVLRLNDRKYVEQSSLMLDEVQLGLTVWKGRYSKINSSWLRWTDKGGVLIPTGAERADKERQRADALEAKLRALGQNPEV